VCSLKSVFFSFFFFLHEGETQNVTAKREHILRVSEEKVARKMFGAHMTINSAETSGLASQLWVLRPVVAI
jgi:hypothetical protein